MAHSAGMKKPCADRWCGVLLCTVLVFPLVPRGWSAEEPQWPRTGAEVAAGWNAYNAEHYVRALALWKGGAPGKSAPAANRFPEER